MCSAKRSILGIAGVSCQAARIRGSGGCQPAPTRERPGNISQSRFHSGGNGQTRSFSRQYVTRLSTVSFTFSSRYCHPKVYGDLNFCHRLGSTIFPLCRDYTTAARIIRPLAVMLGHEGGGDRGPRPNETAGRGYGVELPHDGERLALGLPLPCDVLHNATCWSAIEDVSALRAARIMRLSKDRTSVAPAAPQILIREDNN